MTKNEINPNYLFLKNKIDSERMILLQGSTRSGKTYSIIYFFIWFCRKYQNANIEIDLCRDTFTALKATAWKDFNDILISTGIYNERDHNKTDHIYNLFGNKINYYGADDPKKIHGRTRDILWINEAHQFPQDVIDQLFPRTKYRIIADFNPALGLEHWLDEYIEKYPPIITTYKDNPYLTREQIEDIESRKGNKYWWSVYGEGIRANREGLIFEGWQVGEFDNSISYCYGQDFGFTNDPTTLIKVAVDKRKKILYCHEEYFNSNGLNTAEIFKLNKEYIKRPSDLIVADSAEPRLIYEVKKLGLNIINTKKFDGSVLYGINKMLEYTIVITPQSRNLQKEFSSYVWNDKRAGIPIDKNNHGIDAVRYAFLNLIKDQTGMSKAVAVDHLY